MKRSLKILVLVLITGLVPASISGLYWLDFHIWRLAHPQAPAWTYLFTK